MKEQDISLGKTEILSWKEEVFGKKLFIEGMLYEELKQNATKDLGSSNIAWRSEWATVHNPRCGGHLTH